MFFRRILLCLGVILGAGMPPSFSYGGSSDAPVIIANYSIGIDQLTLPLARAVFTMHLTRWPDGAPITIVILNDSAYHHRFAHEILKSNPKQLQQAWNRLIFTGRANNPTSVNTWKEMLDVIASTPGAIGYISENMANASVTVVGVRYE